MAVETEEIASLIETDPGCTVAELCRALRSRGRVSITTADVIRVLAGHPRKFRHDDEKPGRWWPASSGAEPSPLSPALPRSTPASMPTLYRWQVEALGAWKAHGKRGVIEAVTGTGKTMVGVAAIFEALGAGGQACVLVPTRELMRQWRTVLERCLPAGLSVGLLGGGQRDGLGDHDALVAIVNSARGADLRPRRPGGLIIADECHRYASDENHGALDEAFPRRLGLSATYARADNGHRDRLDPYFGGTCYRLGYAEAMADGVIAPFSVSLGGVTFDADEREEYDELTLTMSGARAQLIALGTVPPEPIGVFLRAVSRLARGGDEGSSVARMYLAAMQNRRRLLAETPAKLDLLACLAPAIGTAQRTIVFTQTIASAQRSALTLRAVGVGAVALHSELSAPERTAILDHFDAGSTPVVVAPQLLDEGIDVPAADLAIIVASSRSRRQMVQRMGRVLRRKQDGRAARFVVLFVEGTVDDPATGAHEGFLDEVMSVAQSVRTFRASDSWRAAPELCAHLAT